MQILIFTYIVKMLSYIDTYINNNSTYNYLRENIKLIFIYETEKVEY